MNAPAPTTQAPAPEKRQVDYDRILKELEKAKVWMGIHWTYENGDKAGKKPNLRTFTDEHGLDYVRMINHTYPLKKMENLEVCEKYLDDEIKSMKAKKDKQANPQPKEKKAKPCLIKPETSECETQTESDASTVLTSTTEPPEHVAITPDEYTKICAWDHNQRVGLTVRLKKQVEKFNQLLDLLKERDGHDEWVESLDDEEKKLMKRSLVLGLMDTASKPKVFATNEEVRESIQKKVTTSDEHAKRIADQVARATT